MTIINDIDIDLDALTLYSGAHKAASKKMCILEAVAYVAGEPWSDHPECASKVIGAFLRSWNDTLDDDTRNRLLKPYVLKLVGTVGTSEQESVRAWMCLDWLVRTYTPAWLRTAGLHDQADLLVGLPEFKAGMDVPSVKSTITAVRQDAHAAGAAAGAAAWDAAWDAAGAAAWDAAWDAAGAAAGAAAGDAAWAAAWDAARDAAWAAAWDAARAAAGDAAWDAARERLQPGVDELQTSALDLVDRMVAVTDSP
jgi:hypothetical protein